MKVLITQQVGLLCGKAKFASSSCFGNAFSIEFVKRLKDESCEHKLSMHCCKGGSLINDDKILHRSIQKYF